MSAVKIGIIGMSKRMNEVYPAVLKSLEDEHKIEIVAISNRTLEKAERFIQKQKLDSCVVFQNAQELLHSNLCDVVIISLKSPLKETIAITALKTGHHVFLETPASSFSYGVKSIEKAAQQSNCLVQVAEDFAFFPHVELARKLQIQNNWGEVIRVENHHWAFSYHAGAVLGSLSTKANISQALSYKHSGDSRLYYRDILFKDISYHEVYPHDRTDSIKKEKKLIIKFQREDFDSSLVPVSLDTFQTEREYALYLLLKNMIATIQSDEELLYPISQAVNDVKIWRTSQLQLKFKLLRIITKAKILHNIESIAGIAYSIFKTIHK